VTEHLMEQSGTDLKMAKLLASAAICQKWGCYKEVQVDECNEENMDEILDIIIEDVEMLRHILTPPDIAPTTDPILDELLEEFRDELLNFSMVDEDTDFIPTRDIEELEQLLTEYPRLYF
ncbi:hypothetical protein Tco_0830325, partial [Tanacetum coccineum]